MSRLLSILEDYLENFNGCAIAVSHDRYFLDRSVEFIFAIEPGGEIRQYPGNYSVYLDYKKTEEKETREVKQKEATTKQKTTSNSKSNNNKSRRLSNYERKEYEQLEGKIADMEIQKEELEKTLYHNPPSGFSEVQELSEKLVALNEEIDKTTERWMELAERDS